MARLEDIQSILFKESLGLALTQLNQVPGFESNMSFKRVFINADEVFIYTKASNYHDYKGQRTGTLIPQLASINTEKVGELWDYALKKRCKFFFLSAFLESDLNVDPEKDFTILKNYIVSIECLKPKEMKSYFSFKNAADMLKENKTEKVYRMFDQEAETYLTFIKKEFLEDYLAIFDNRPYMYADSVNKEQTRVQLEKWIEIEKQKTKLGQARNRLLFGAPGTGKSYKLEMERKELSEQPLYENDSSIKKITSHQRVTFHSEYSYGDFVGTYKPVQRPDEDGNSKISYEYVPGPFVRILVKALRNLNNNYLLIIEEINRANASSVFGDIFQLLDRDSDGISSYGIKASLELEQYLEKQLGTSVDELRLPPNLYIWATMNSADQGVFALDSAFKRRWSFEYISIDGELGDHQLHRLPVYLRVKKGGVFERLSWNKFRTAINDKLKKLDIEEDKLIGPRFLSHADIADADDEKAGKKATSAVVDKLLAYIRQDVLKYNPHVFFREGYTTMTDIRNAFRNEAVTIYDILDLDKSIDLEFVISSDSKGAGDSTV